MTHSTFTKQDLGRRNLSLLSQREVQQVLPEYYQERYPKLITFLEKYYDWADSDVSPSHLIQDLFLARDISQTPNELLDFLEDELLLGQEYFGGFQNKRAAAKISNIFYRSKGTKFSIQQFFNAFFGIDVDVQYPKSQRFIVGESEIGFESQRFLTNAELYQVFAVLIKSELPLADWNDVYKLFVHPAGMYLGAQLQVVSVADATPGTDSATPLTIARTIQGDAVGSLSAIADTTAIVILDSDLSRLRVDNNTIGQEPRTYADLYSMGQLDSAYDTVSEFLDTNSFRMDEGVGDPAIMRMDNTIEQMDEVNYKYYDSST
jgi:hypothetical protein